MLELVDVFVWVTDPQKYADARLHDDFVSILSRHGAVTLAVLNQSDRLPEAGVKAVVSDLGALLESDGVGKAHGAAHLDGDGRRPRRAAPAPRQCRCRTRGLASAAALRPRRRGIRVAARRRRQRARHRLARPAERSTPRSRGRPGCRSCSTQWPATTAARPSPTPAGSSPAGRRASPPTRCAGCASTAPVGDRRSRSRSRAPTCVRCSAARRSRRPPRPPPRRSTSRPAPSCATPPTDFRCGGSSPSRTPSTAETAGSPTPSTRRCSPPRCARAGRSGGSSSTSCSGRSDSSRSRGLVWLAVLWVVGLLALPRPETPSFGILPVPLLMLVGGVLLGLGLGRAVALVGAHRCPAPTSRRGRPPDGLGRRGGRRAHPRSRLRGALPAPRDAAAPRRRRRLTTRAAAPASGRVTSSTPPPGSRLPSTGPRWGLLPAVRAATAEWCSPAATAPPDRDEEHCA